MINKYLNDYLVVIPARYNSKRLPGKLLFDLGSEKVLEKVINICLKVIKKKNLIIATDSKLIFNFCKKKNFPVLMTSKKCLTGSDRVYEVAKKIKKQFYINVQGDEILLNPNTIAKVIKVFKKNMNTQVVNCYTKITSEKEFRNNSIIKTVFDKNDNLKYMSRSPIPGNKFDKFFKAYKQVCVYGFSRKSILLFGKKRKSFFENIEDIEILRFLEMNKKIHLVETKRGSIAVDIPTDVIKVENELRKI